MSQPYRIDFTHQATIDFEGIPETIRGEVAVHLDMLAEDPHGLSHKSVPPREVPGYCVYRIEFIEAFDGRYGVTIFFHFGDDEQSILVKGFGWRPYAD